jgi:RNA polymerase sigma-70 factor (ECF subfamily)
MIDAARHRKVKAVIDSLLEMITDTEIDPYAETPISDRRLALMFACAHPAIESNIRAPLILQTVLGFDAATVASAFLVSQATMSQRLVRAKNKIKSAGIPFAIPDTDMMNDRLEPVLDAIYAAYFDGWSDPLGTEVHRLNLADEAIWLGRLIATLMREQAEALGLLALILYTEARKGARRSNTGEYVPLSHQDVSLWNMAFIDEAETLLSQAAKLGHFGRYQLEAAIQSAHVARRKSGKTDWTAIVLLYDALYEICKSPEVAINRAVALSMAEGPHTGLDELKKICDYSGLRDYQPYWAALASVFNELGMNEKANDSYDIAIGLESDIAVRRFLQKRKSELIKPAI